MLPDMSEAVVSNAPEWTVSELSGALRRTLEDAYGHVRVRAELGGVKIHSSGHVYLDLKDERSCLAGVIWKGTAGRLRFRPETGMEVIATGRITTFAGQSKYQLVIDTLEPAGVGALLAQLEERRKRLAAEGLFAPERKQLLPFLPRVIGVVTSPTGAVIRDIMHRLEDRFPRHVLVWPVRVQGETCAAEVSAAIRGFNSLPEAGPIPRPDLLIVARGGGSLEDLWGFNDELVVRAAAESVIPLISAVGHETDTTLIDFAADRRAPTPTGAAEMAVPVRAELMATAGDLGRRLVGALLRGVEARRDRLRGLARGLPRPDMLVAAPRQRLDLASNRLDQALATATRRHAQTLVDLSARLARRSPGAQLGIMRERLGGYAMRLPAALQRHVQRQREYHGVLAGRFGTAGSASARAATVRVENDGDRLARLAARVEPALRALLRRRREQLASQGQLLVSYSYEGVLRRGYALVRGADGLPVRAAAEISGGMALDIQFADGHVRAVAGEGSRPRPAAPRAKAAPEGQGSLFGS
jgi:exodeoxyribonuclease VII large subunit